MGTRLIPSCGSCGPLERRPDWSCFAHPVSPDRVRRGIQRAARPALRPRVPNPHQRAADHTGNGDDPENGVRPLTAPPPATATRQEAHPARVPAAPSPTRPCPGRTSPPARPLPGGRGVRRARRALLGSRRPQPRPGRERRRVVGSRSAASSRPIACSRRCPPCPLASGRLPRSARAGRCVSPPRLTVRTSGAS